MAVFYLKTFLVPSPDRSLSPWGAGEGDAHVLMGSGSSCPVGRRGLNRKQVLQAQPSPALSGKQVGYDRSRNDGCLPAVSFQSVQSWPTVSGLVRPHQGESSLLCLSESTFTDTLRSEPSRRF